MNLTHPTQNPAWITKWSLFVVLVFFLLFHSFWWKKINTWSAKKEDIKEMRQKCSLNFSFIYHQHETISFSMSSLSRGRGKLQFEQTLIKIWYPYPASDYIFQCSDNTASYRIAIFMKMVSQYNFYAWFFLMQSQCLW